MRERLDTLISGWTRLGAGFSAAELEETPDVERLLLETARLSGAAARVFIMATTWLNMYGDLVAKHRLKRLLRDELESEYRATLGLLLDIAQRGTHPAQFASTIREIEPNPCPRALFEVERGSEALSDRARRQASDISRRWGLWCEEFEFKRDALRPASWVMSRNPRLIARADFRGDLRASVLAALEHDPDAGASELALARRSGGSRAQVRSALRNLEITGKAKRVRTDHDRRTQIILGTSLLAAAVK